MPTKKRYSRKPRSVDAKQNKEISKLKTEVKKLVKAEEIKAVDNLFSELFINNSLPGGSKRVDLTAIAPWESNALNANTYRRNHREGNQIVIKRFQLDGMITLPSDSDQAGNTDKSYDAVCRVIIAHTPASGFLDIAELLEVPNDVFSFYKLNPDNPYRVLYDKHFTMQSSTQLKTNATFYETAPVEPMRRRIKILLNSKQLGKTGIKVEYGQGNVGLSPVYGGLTMFLLSNVAGATFIKPDLEARARMRFADN